jgi:hypothetical protein
MRCVLEWCEFKHALRRLPVARRRPGTNSVAAITSRKSCASVDARGICDAREHARRIRTRISSTCWASNYLITRVRRFFVARLPRTARRSRSIRTTPPRTAQCYRLGLGRRPVGLCTIARARSERPLRPASLRATALQSRAAAGKRHDRPQSHRDRSLLGGRLAHLVRSALYEQ